MAKLSARGRYTVAEASWTDNESNTITIRRLMSDGKTLVKYNYGGYKGTWKVSKSSVKFNKGVTPEEWITVHKELGWRVKEFAAPVATETW